jgi:hypothetical protein
VATCSTKGVHFLPPTSHVLRALRTVIRSEHITAFVYARSHILSLEFSVDFVSTVISDVHKLPAVRVQ